MEKKVFCTVLGRCKCIKFISSTTISDIEIVKFKLLELCVRDSTLKLLLENKQIILQKKDLDVGIYIDIEEHEEINHLDNLNVLVVPIHQDLSLPSTSQSCAIEELEGNAVIKVLYTEPATMPLDLQDELPLNNINTNKENDGQVDNVSDRSSSECEDEKLSEEPKSKNLKLHDITLPKLTIDIEKKIETRGVLASNTSLINFWGNYLWEITETKPTKEHYADLATKITSKFPELRGGRCGIGIVRKQLSVWTRNHRSNLKTQATKRDKDGKILSRALIESQETNQMNSTDIQKAMEELQKNHSDRNIPHVKKLLKITLPQRRQWIQKDAESIANIVKRFPQLKEYGLVLFEFNNIKNINSDNLNANVNLMFQKLLVYYGTDENTDESKYAVLTKLCSDVSKKVSKNAIPLFTLKQVGSSTEDIKARLGESPRCVIYMNEEKIAVAYIVADNDTQVKIKSPTMEKIIVCLLAAYYVWDTKFPPAYKNILQYIDNALLGTSIQDNQVISKFIRNRDAIVKGTSKNRAENKES